MNNKQIPSIRFKGYNEVWEQHKFGELLQTLPFKPFLKEPEQDGKYEIIQQGSEPIIGFANGIPCNDYKDTVIFGDHTLSLYKPKHPFFVATDGVRIVKGKQNIDGYYLLSLLERYKPQSEGYKRYYSILSDIECFIINNTKEQKQIGSYFEQLDNLITLHQHKYDKLINIKKSMLQKMFPKDETDVPEIRFKGFNDVWEQRKFGEIVIRYDDQVDIPEDGYWRLGIRSHAKGTFHSFVEKGKELSAARMSRIKAGNFIVNITFGWEHAVAITDENDENKLVSHRFPQFSFKKGHNPYFYKYVISDVNFKHHLWLSSPGGAGRNRVLKIDEMLDYKMSFPNKDEQDKIFEFLNQLDNLITLYQCKLEKLQNIKKSMLEKIFPSNK
jgi:type I restriction enzyme S subunit